MKTLLIDNYDSFTFNLYHLLAIVNDEAPIVITNDQFSWEEINQITFDNVVISPGPGHPDRPKDFGICGQLIQKLPHPILGICLGHQGIASQFGGQVILAPEVRHGRVSNIRHNASPLFQGIPNPFLAVRYHSLIVDHHSLPPCLEPLAWTEDQLIMALGHREKYLWGVQFHPESIASEYGVQLFQNFKKLTLNYWRFKVLDPGIKRQINGSKTINLNPKDNYYDRHQNNQPNQDQKHHKFTLKLWTKTLPLDRETQTLFEGLYAQKPYSFWLDSSRVESGLSRFSFMGDDTGNLSFRVTYDQASGQIIRTSHGQTQVHQGEDGLQVIQDYLDRYGYDHCLPETGLNLPFDFWGGFVGYFAYELKRDCGASFAYESELPTIFLLFVTRFLAIDHQENLLYLVYVDYPDQEAAAHDWFEEIMSNLRQKLPLNSDNASPVQGKSKSNHSAHFYLDRSQATYLQDIEFCLDKIRQGETYEVCLTNQIYSPDRPDPWSFYKHLRQRNPAPYACFLKTPNFAIVCSSPERFLKIDRQGWVETKPIKGTVARGQTPEDDNHQRSQLGQRDKERSENLMVLDLLRHDLGRVCDLNTVSVPKMMVVETYATVHQLVSTIRGKLRQDLGVTDCLRSVFPGGSMTGAPKLRTLEIIDALEGKARGIYSGCLGFLSLNKTADLNIVIRTAIVRETGTYIGIGGGLVALSDPEAEFQETLLKGQALMEAFTATIHGDDQASNYYLHLD